jgi:hypothetical protein
MPTVRETQDLVEKAKPLFLDRLATVLCERQGGTPKMMGQRPRSEPLFYYFRLEDQIPEDHLL